MSTLRTTRKIVTLEYICSYNDEMPLSQAEHLFETKDDAKTWLKEEYEDEVEVIANAVDSNDDKLFTREEVLEICPTYYDDRDNEDDDYPCEVWRLTENVEVLGR